MVCTGNMTKYGITRLHPAGHRWGLFRSAVTETRAPWCCTLCVTVCWRVMACVGLYRRASRCVDCSMVLHLVCCTLLACVDVCQCVSMCVTVYRRVLPAVAPCVLHSVGACRCVVGVLSMCVDVCQYVLTHAALCCTSVHLVSYKRSCTAATGCHLAGIKQRVNIKLDWIDCLSLSMCHHKCHIGLSQLSTTDSLLAI